MLSHQQFGSLRRYTIREVAHSCKRRVVWASSEDTIANCLSLRSQFSQLLWNAYRKCCRTVSFLSNLGQLSFGFCTSLHKCVPVFCVLSASHRTTACYVNSFEVHDRRQRQAGLTKRQRGNWFHSLTPCGEKLLVPSQRWFLVGKFMFLYSCALRKFWGSRNR